MPNTDCVQYKKGSMEGPSGCIGAPLLPRSIDQQNDGVPCTFYSEGYCEGDAIETSDSCVNAASYGLESFKSFSCSVG